MSHDAHGALVADGTPPAFDGAVASGPKLPTVRAVFRLLTATPAGIVGLILVGFFVALALVGPWIAPYSPTAASSAVLAPPSSTHLLGTTEIGADVLSQVLVGGRISILVGIAAGAISVVVGTFIGVVRGYFTGFDGALGRIEDFFLILPVLPLMIVVARIFGTSLGVTVLVIGLLSWAGTGRIVRSQVLTLKERAFVERARAYGSSDLQIIWRHILPNIAPLVLATTVLTISFAILTEAALAFLGLVQPGQISWGSMLQNAVQAGAATSGAWWYILPPGLCIVLLVLGISLCGTAIEERFAPNLRIRETEQ